MDTHIFPYSYSYVHLHTCIRMNKSEHLQKSKEKFKNRCKHTRGLVNNPCANGVVFECFRTHIYIYVHMCMSCLFRPHFNVRPYLAMSLCVSIHAHTCGFTDIHMYNVRVDAYICIYIYTYTDTCIYIYIYMCIYTYTHLLCTCAYIETGVPHVMANQAPNIPSKERAQ